MQKPIAKTVNKRLGIELRSLRQNLWRERGKAVINPRMLEDRPEPLSDLCRWIDTKVMVADCLKQMKDDYVLIIVEVMQRRQ